MVAGFSAFASFVFWGGGDCGGPGLLLQVGAKTIRDWGVVPWASALSQEGEGQARSLREGWM